MLHDTHSTAQHGKRVLDDEMFLLLLPIKTDPVTVRYEWKRIEPSVPPSLTRVRRPARQSCHCIALVIVFRVSVDAEHRIAAKTLNLNQRESLFQCSVGHVIGTTVRETDVSARMGMMRTTAVATATAAETQ